MIHDATQTLSDHHPSLIRIAMQPLEQTVKSRSSYLKLDAMELEVESTATTLEWVRKDSMIGDRDPCINWELGWKAIQNEIKRIKKTRDEVEMSRPRPEDQLYELRLEANRNLGSETEQLFHLRELESEVRRRERISVNLWRLRSRSIWLK